MMTAPPSWTTPSSISAKASRSSGSSQRVKSSSIWSMTTRSRAVFVGDAVGLGQQPVQVRGRCGARSGDDDAPGLAARQCAFGQRREQPRTHERRLAGSGGTHDGDDRSRHEVGRDLGDDALAPEEPRCVLTFEVREALERTHDGRGTDVAVPELATALLHDTLQADDFVGDGLLRAGEAELGELRLARGFVDSAGRRFADPRGRLFVDRERDAAALLEQTVDVGRAPVVAVQLADGRDSNAIHRLEQHLLVARCRAGHVAALGAEDRQHEHGGLARRRRDLRDDFEDLGVRLVQIVEHDEHRRVGAPLVEPASDARSERLARDRTGLPRINELPAERNTWSNSTRVRIDGMRRTA